MDAGRRWRGIVAESEPDEAAVDRELPPARDDHREARWMRLTDRSNELAGGWRISGLRAEPSRLEAA